MQLKSRALTKSSAALVALERKLASVKSQVIEQILLVTQMPTAGCALELARPSSVYPQMARQRTVLIELSSAVVALERTDAAVDSVVNRQAHFGVIIALTHGALMASTPRCVVTVGEIR